MSLRVPRPLGGELLTNNKSALMESILLPESIEPPGHVLPYSRESAFYCSQTQSCFNVLIWILAHIPNVIFCQCQQLRNCYVT